MVESKSKIKIFVFVCLPMVILIGLLVVYKVYFSNRIYISPTAPRGFHADTFPSGPCTNFKQYTDGFQITEDLVNGEIIIDDNAVARKRGPYIISKQKPVFLTESNWADLPNEGRVRVSYLAGGRGVADENDSVSYQIAFTDQSPVIKKIFPTDRPTVESPDNGVRIILEFEGIQAGILKGVWIKDSQTGEPVGIAIPKYYDHHMKASNRIGFEAMSDMYHQNPVECAISLDYGEELIYTSPLDEKTMIHLSKHDLFLMKAYPVKKDASDRCFEWFDPNPSQSGAGMDPFGMGFMGGSSSLIKLKDYDPDGEWTRLAMTGSAHGGRYDVYLVTENGPVSPCMEPQYGLHTYYTFDIPFREVVALQVRERPYIAIIKYQLDELPGLPPENRGVKNLMDVKIEAIRIHSAREFENLIRGGLQVVELNTKGLTLTFPTGYFPKDFQNVTFDELLDEYIEHLPASGEVSVNPNFIGLTISPADEEWLESFLKGLI
jgi:hypothetical protein